MTEWDASGYRDQSSLQKWLADEHLAALTLNGAERVLDVGCGDGRITAEIADRVPRGSVLGIDPSSRMIAFAREHCRRGKPRVRDRRRPARSRTGASSTWSSRSTRSTGCPSPISRGRFGRSATR